MVLIQQRRVDGKAMGQGWTGRSGGTEVVQVNLRVE